MKRPIYWDAIEAIVNYEENDGGESVRCAFVSKLYGPTATQVAKDVHRIREQLTKQPTPLKSYILDRNTPCDFPKDI